MGQNGCGHALGARPPHPRTGPDTAPNSYPNRQDPDKTDVHLGSRGGVGLIIKQQLVLLGFQIVSTSVGRAKKFAPKDTTILRQARQPRALGFTERTGAQADKEELVLDAFLL